MTMTMCPHSCGGVVSSDAATCPSCRRRLDTTEVADPSWCWSWFGDPEHRYRCRLPTGHRGHHDTRDREGLGPFPLGRLTAEEADEIYRTCQDAPLGSRFEALVVRVLVEMDSLRAQLAARDTALGEAVKALRKLLKAIAADSRTDEWGNETGALSEAYATLRQLRTGAPSEEER